MRVCSLFLAALLMTASGTAAAATYGKQIGGGSSGGGLTGSTPWGGAAEAWCTSKVATVNAFKDIPYGQSSNGSTVGTNFVAGTMEGGSYGETNAAWTSLTDSAFFKTPVSGVGCTVVRLQFPTITVGSTAYIGLINAANTHFILVDTDRSVSTTHVNLLITGAGGSTNPVFTAVADTAPHDLAFVYDGTTLTVYLDGVSQATATLATYLTDETFFLKVNGATAFAPGVQFQEAVIGFHSTTFASSSCVYPDGSQQPGVCMFNDEFTSAATLCTTPGSCAAGTRWIGENNWYGFLQAISPENGCVIATQNSISGGFLNQTMTAHSRASCTQTWNGTGPPYTTTACGGSSCATSYPAGQPTTYDTAEISANWTYLYGYYEWKGQMPGGTGPGGDLTLWGHNCQSRLGFVDAFFSTPSISGGTSGCRWPLPGSSEIDVLNYSHANGVLDLTMYVDNSVGAPPFVGNFFGTNYYGYRAATPLTGGFQAFIGGTTVTDPSLNVHTYATDWRPGYLAHLIDGVIRWTHTGPDVPNQPMYAMPWNADTTPVTLGTLPQTAAWDYARLTCQDASTPCQIFFDTV